MDHGQPVEDAASIVIPAIWPMVAIATAFFLFRIYIRVARSRGQVWWDDGFLAVAWILLVVAASTLTAALKRGHLTSSVDEALSVGVLTRAAHTFHLLCLALAKTSFALCLLRFSGKMEKAALWIIMASVNVLLVYHAFLNWRAICGEPTDNTLPGTCWRAGQVTVVSIVSSSYSAVTDMILALLPWRIIWNRNLEKAERRRFLAAMAFCIIATANGAMKSVQSVRILDTTHSDHGNRHTMLLWLFSLAEPTALVIAASIPLVYGTGREASQGPAYGSTPAAVGYVRSEGNLFLAHPQLEPRKSENRARAQTLLSDTASESSILEGSHHHLHRGGGITLKTEVSVEFDNKPDGEPRFEVFELRPGVTRSNSIKVKGRQEVVLSSPPLPAMKFTPRYLE